MSYSQLSADISLPVTPELLRRALDQGTLDAIYKTVGRDELSRIAAATHGKDPNPDYDALAKREGEDLNVLRQAISAATGKNQPWIMGFASDFANGLLATHQNSKS